MFRLTATSSILILLVLTIMPWTMPSVLSSLSGMSEAWAQAGKADLMQQSDHKQRANKQAKPEPVEQQTAGVIPIEANAGDGDYVVLAILVASVVVLAFVAACGKKVRFKSRPRAR